MPSPGRGVRGGIVSDFCATFRRENVTWAGFTAASGTVQYSVIGAGVNVSAAGGHYQGWVRRTGSSTSVNLFARTGSNAGIACNALTGTAHNFTCVCGTGSATVTTTQAYDASSPAHVCLAYTGAEFRVWVNGVRVFTQATAFAAATTANALTASANTGLSNVAWAGHSTAVPTDAEVLTAYRAGLVAGDVVAIPGKTESLYSWKQQGSLSDTWVDQIGGVNMSRTAGSASYTTFADTQSDSWFDASAYATAGGKVTALIDRVDNSHLLSQATAANQVVNPTVSGNFGGSPSFAFTGAQTYLSTRRKSLFRYLHDATGGTAIIAYRPTTPVGGAAKVFAATRFAGDNSSPSGTGFVSYLNSTTGGPAANVANGATVYVSSAGSAPVGVAQYQTSLVGVNNTLRVRGAEVVSTPVTPPSDSDPTSTLRLGFSFAALATVAEIAGIYLWRRALTAPELAIAQRYLAVTMGLNA